MSNAFRARVKGGRLILDEPTSLPEGLAFLPMKSSRAFGRDIDVSRRAHRRRSGASGDGELVLARREGASTTKRTIRHSTRRALLVAVALFAPVGCAKVSVRHVPAGVELSSSLRDPSIDQSGRRGRRGRLERDLLDV